MKLSPSDILGTLKGDCPPLVIKKRKNFFFLTGNHSSLLLYNLKNLKLKKVSPFLHHSIPISNISCSKNRNFLALGNTLHILEMSIPITRFSVFKNPISFVFLKKNFLLCFSKKEKKAILFNASNLKIIARIFFPKNTSILEINNRNQAKFELYIGTKEGKIEIWSLLRFEKIVSIVFFPSFLIRFLKPNENLKKIVVGKNKKDLIVLNLKPKKNSQILKSRGKNKIEKIFPFSKNENGIFFSFKNFLFFWETSTNIITTRKFLIHNGNISIEKLNFNKKLFLTLGYKDNSFGLYRFKKGKNKIKLMKYQNGNFWPLRVSKRLKNIEGSLVLSDSRSFFSLQTICGQNQFFFSKENLSNQLKFGFFTKTKIFDKKKKKKLVIEQIEAIRDFFDFKKITLVFHFFHSEKLWVWETDKKTLYPIFLKNYFDSKKKEKISFLVISPKGTSFLICSSKGSIFSMRVPDGDLINKSNFHCTPKEGCVTCQITGCDFDETGNFFAIGCSYGFVELWNIQLKPKKRLWIEKKILGLKWDLKSDLIMFSCKDHSLYLVFPENFSAPRVFRGHSGPLNDFRIFGSSTFLATASMDCSVKIWELSKNFCIDTLVNKYPTIALNFDQNETCLVSTHRNTTGVGVWKINDSFWYCNSGKSLEKARKSKKEEETFSIFSNYGREISSQIKSMGFLFKKNSYNKLFLYEKELPNSENSKKRSKKLKNFSGKKFQEFLSFQFLDLSERPTKSSWIKKKLKSPNFSKEDFLLIQAVFLENLFEIVFNKFYLLKNFKGIVSFLSSKHISFFLNKKNEFLFEKISVEIKRIDFLFQSFFEKFFFN